MMQENEKRLKDRQNNTADKQNLISQWTKQNRQRTHSVDFDPTYSNHTAGCKQQLVVKITAGCYTTKLEKIQLSRNRTRPANL